MRMIAANNLTGDGIQMKTLEELVCSPTLTSGRAYLESHTNDFIEKSNWSRAINQ